MRNNVYAALVAAGVIAVAGAANAAEPIKLGLGGSMKWYVSFADQEADDGNNTGNRDLKDFNLYGNNEVHFTGSTTLDNGLKVSVKVELEAGGNNSPVNDSIDNTFLTLEGGFGKVEIGSVGSAPDSLNVGAPTAAFDADEVLSGKHVVAPVNAAGQDVFSAGAGLGETGGQRRINYYTPNFAGFTAGITWGNGGASNGLDSDARDIESADGVLGENYGLSLGYDGQFGAVGFKASAGWETFDAQNVEQYDGFAVGAELAWSGWTFGTNYAFDNFENVDGDDRDGQAWEFGVTYATGPYAVGVAYEYGEREQAGDGEDEYNTANVNAKYTMGPGVSLVGLIGWADYDEGTVAVEDNDGWAVVTGIEVSF